MQNKGQLSSPPKKKSRIRPGRRIQDIEEADGRYNNIYDIDIATNTTFTTVTQRIATTLDTTTTKRTRLAQQKPPDRV